MKKKSPTKYLALLTISIYVLTYFFLIPLARIDAPYAQGVDVPQPTRVATGEKRTSKTYIPTGASSTYMKTSDGAEHLLIQDHITSTRIIESNKGAQQQEYYPYGMTSGEPTTLTDKQFTSHRNMIDTQIYHFGARFYNPLLGSFIQADKIENANRYAYVKNNPISNTDPTGNFTCRRCGDLPNLLSSFGNTNSFPDSPTKPTGIKAIMKANIANLLSAVGVLGFLPESSFNQYVSKNQVQTDFMLATSPGAAMISAPRMNVPQARFTFSPLSGQRLGRTYDSVMSEAQYLFRNSKAIGVAREGAAELASGRPNFDTYNRFIRSINSEGVRTAWDAPGAFAPNGRLHTDQGNLIRTLDSGSQRVLVMHPDIRTMLDTNPMKGLDEAYFHGVHDFAAVQLGFHSPTHPHRGLATGFHYLDYLFNRSVGKNGQGQLIRFNQTRAREFNIPFGSNP